MTTENPSTAIITSTNKRKERPYEDIVSFTVAVPNNFVYEEDDGDEGRFERDIHYKLYSCQGYKGETLRDIFTPEKLKWMNVEGPFDIFYRDVGGYGKR